MTYSFSDFRYPISDANCRNSEYRFYTGFTEFDNADHQPNPFGSTPVDLDLFINKIPSVDLNNNIYRVRGGLTMVWCDVRKKFDKKLGDYQLMNDGVAELALQYGKIWNPEIRIWNNYEKRASDNIRIYVFNDGTIVYREIFTVDVRTIFDLTKIPYDDHYLELQIGSLTWDKDQVHIIKEEMITEFADDFIMPGWNKVDFIEDLKEINDEKTKRTYSVLTTKIHVVRSSYINMYKIVVPTMIFVFISSLTFVYSNTLSDLHSRVELMMKNFLALVAYQIIIETQMPKYVWGSFLNLIVVSAQFLMCMGVLFSLFLTYIYENFDKKKADSLSGVFMYYINILFYMQMLGLYIYLVDEIIVGMVIPALILLGGIGYVVYEFTNAGNDNNPDEKLLNNMHEDLDNDEDEDDKMHE